MNDILNMQLGSHLQHQAAQAKVNLAHELARMAIAVMGDANKTAANSIIGAQQQEKEARPTPPTPPPE
jgi:hypothetical protein